MELFTSNRSLLRIWRHLHRLDGLELPQGRRCSSSCPDNQEEGCLDERRELHVSDGDTVRGFLFPPNLFPSCERGERRDEWGVSFGNDFAPAVVSCCWWHTG